MRFFNALDFFAKNLKKGRGNDSLVLANLEAADSVVS